MLTEFKVVSSTLCYECVRDRQVCPSMCCVLETTQQISITSGIRGSTLQSYHNSTLVALYVVQIQLY
jgi:hypothetical protein